jgi:3-oxoadipate CoA-transferase, beta subunit
MMEHVTKSGEPKLVPALTYPVTGLACVSRVITDLAVIDLAGGAARVVEMAEGLTFEQLQAQTGVPLTR